MICIVAPILESQAITTTPELPEYNNWNQSFRRCYPYCIMRLLCFCVLFVPAMLPGLAQTAANAGPGLPSDPREIFAAAAPFYDFSSPDMKPWHLKASYQLYDEKGKPGEQGTYEFWWASPQVIRSTWTRPGATYSQWHMADGAGAHQETGERIGYFEKELGLYILSPLPLKLFMDPARFRLDRETLPVGKVKLPCFSINPPMQKPAKLQVAQYGSFCFDTHLPILLLTFRFSSVTTEFHKIVEFQNKYLPRAINVFYEKRELLSATVDTIELMDPSDPALKPPQDTTVVKAIKKMQIGAGVMAGMLVRKQQPVYPEGAKSAGISGNVLLEATIGKDGKIHDLRVILSSSSLLSDSAMEAVSHWEYKPYLLNGEPVEVETTVNVIYSLGG